MARPIVEINVKRCNRLKQLISETGIRQTQLSELTNISQQAISNMVQCKANVTETTARAVIEVFPQYNFDWLMGYSDYKTGLEQKIVPIASRFADKKLKENAVNNFLKAYGLYFEVHSCSVPPSMSIEDFNCLPSDTRESILKGISRFPKFSLIEAKSQKVIAIFSEREYENFITDINDYVEFKFDKLVKQKGID